MGKQHQRKNAIQPLAPAPSPITGKTPVIAVIGGGPAGLMAAGTAAAAGAEVHLFEKNSQCGKKLLITGSGKCNITSNAPFEAFLDQFPDNKKFLYPAFKIFFVDEVKEFFGQRQVPLILEENGKYFPESKKASDVLNALLAFCHEHHVHFHYEEPVREIVENHTTTESMPFPRTIITDRGSYQADCIVISTGGLSYPKTGSSGDGYRLAEALSHSITPTRPALVPMEVSDPDCSPLSGISLRNVLVTLWEQDEAVPPRKCQVQNGDLLFTHFGISGPPVLFLSRWIREKEEASPFPNYFVTVDLFPGLSLTDIESDLLRIFGSTPNRQLKTVLSKEFEIPHAVAALLVSCCALKEDVLCQEVNRESRKKLLSVLKSFRLSISGTRGYKEAMVTAGGVSTKEIDPRTMESRHHPGIFFAGEVIDIDGYTGGYNLQAAFSTGYLAGRSSTAKFGL